MIDKLLKTYKKAPLEIKFGTWLLILSIITPVIVGIINK